MVVVKSNLCFQPGSDILTMEAAHWRTAARDSRHGSQPQHTGNHYLHHHAATMVVDGIDSVRYAGYGGVVVGTEYRLPDFKNHRWPSLYIPSANHRLPDGTTNVWAWTISHAWTA